MVTKSDFRAFHLAETSGGGETGCARLGVILCLNLSLGGSVSKGLPLAKPHPKAQEVHRLAPSQGRAFLNLQTGCGMVPTGGDGRGRKWSVKKEVTLVCGRWG